MHSWAHNLLLVVSVAFAGTGTGVGPANAAARPNSLFSDGAVLQQNSRIPIFGTADEGEAVTVQLGGQTARTKAKSGKWQVVFKPLKAGGPYTLKVTGTGGEFVAHDILVGEVWVCSGQSNMGFTLHEASTGPEAIAASNDPKLRLYQVPNRISNTPLTDASAQWHRSAPETTRDFSAVAYFFGRDLRKALGVPVGLIETQWGGTPAQAWTSDAVLKTLPDFQQAVAAREAAPALPAGTDPNAPGVLYNGMIAPLVPYSIRGAIWYQGESNTGDPIQYRTLLPAMISGWRRDWGEGAFPFLLVQLAPFMKIVHEPRESNWALLREAQRQIALTLPHTGMAVITDVGDENNIHPTRKEPVGQRLALAARGLVYNEDIEYSGPLLNTVRVEKDQMILSFHHEEGLRVQGGGPLTGFTVAGEDGKYVNANASIIGKFVVVSSPLVPQPTAVRFGWADYPVINLINGAGLPASPFQTDPFPTRSKP